MIALHIWDDGQDFVVATTADEAEALWFKHFGVHGAGVTRVQADWDQLPDDHLFTFDMGDGCKPEEMTAAEWCAKHGAGYIASRDH